MDVDEAVAWYESERPKYVALASLLQRSLEELVAVAGIQVLDVTSRTKSLGSFRAKYAGKSYQHPKQSTDLAGARVIAFIETDARKLSEVVRKSFRVLEQESVDKSEELGEREVGYRSIHIVCEVDPHAVGDFSLYKGMVFEIQIRTALQHAWAEIEHDRGYKFAGVLPAPLRRRLNLVAAQLELADLEFARLAEDIGKYEVELASRANEHILAPSSRAIIPFLESLSPRLGSLRVTPSDPDEFASVLDELYAFGAVTVSDVKALFSDSLLNSLSGLGGSTTQIGLLRKAMMFSDLERYFGNAWLGRWTGLSWSTRQLIESKWGAAKLADVEGLLLRLKKR